MREFTGSLPGDIGGLNWLETLYALTLFLERALRSLVCLELV